MLWGWYGYGICKCAKNSLASFFVLVHFFIFICWKCSLLLLNPGYATGCHWSWPTVYLQGSNGHFTSYSCVSEMKEMFFYLNRSAVGKVTWRNWFYRQSLFGSTCKSFSIGWLTPSSGKNFALHQVITELTINFQHFSQGFPAWKFSGLQCNMINHRLLIRNLF